MKLLIRSARYPAGLGSRVFVPDNDHLNGVSGQRGSI